MKWLFLFVLSLVLSLSSFAQQPSFYKIGSDELAGIDVYSILQDHEGNMWLTTENGLMRYDGYTFHEYNIEGMKLRSLFGLTLDKKGTVFCHSVNGQIYHVKDDSLQLYYELPDSNKWIYMHMEFDDRNQMIISCRNYYCLSPEKELKPFMSWKFPRNFSMKKSEDGEILLADLSNNRIAGLKNGEISEFAPIPKEYSRYFENIQIVSNRSLFLGVADIHPKLFEFRKDSIHLIQLKDLNNAESRASVFVDNDNTIWMAYETNGLQMFQRNGTSLFGDELLFPNYRISAFFQDREGNYWLPTFGRGIIVIPSLEIVDIGKSEGLDDLSLLSICKDDNDNIFIGSQRGSLFKIENDTLKKDKVSPQLLQKYNHVLARISYLEEEGVVYSGADFLDPKTGRKKEDFLISKKEPKRFSDYGWLIPLNTGVLFHPEKNSTRTKEVIRKFSFKPLVNQGVKRIGRTYVVHWDPILENIWASTSLGLKLISPDGVRDKKLNGNPIYASAFFDDGELLWVTTRNAGVLVFKGERLIRQMTEEDGLLSNNILDVKCESDWMYFSTRKGIQRYNVRKSEFQRLTQSNGVNTNNIIDFEVTKGDIWVITPNGLQKMPKTVFVQNNVAPILVWDNAVANDSIQLVGEHARLTYEEDKIYFEFHANAFHHRGELKYHYKLKGLQDDWKELDFSQNSIVFNSLSPGTYTFVVRAKNENGVFSNYLQKTFTIAPPFWETWWFYLLCAAFVLLLFVLFFRLRLSIVKKRLIVERELKVSEIKAIKAQMNPHFVFNALNSLQDLVMMEDIRSTNIYLTRFAELMRGTLELSGKQFIPLEREIEMLELYLQLEKLRFGDEFQYAFQLNLKKASSEYLIPTMLLQPYVENAVKHGLLHKEKDKQLTISFADTQDGFSCEITDNGVGRNKSSEINKRRSPKHESFSQEANQSRIDLINQTLSHKIEHQIIDLMEDGVPVGTKVVFHFSYQTPTNG